MSLLDTGVGSSADERRLAVRGVGGPLAFPGVAGVSAPNSASGSDLNLATLWRIFWEWRWLILSLLVAGTAAAIIFTLLTTPMYRSTTTLELNPPRVEVLDRETAGGDGPESMDAQFIGTQLGLLRSRALAERVVQDANLSSDANVVEQSGPRAAREQSAVATVESSLDVLLEPQSRLVRVSAESSDPTVAAKIANGAAESYINSTLERRYQSSSYARDFLQRQIATVRRDLETSERQLVAYAQQQRLITTGNAEQSGSDGASLTGETLVALNSALSNAQARRIAAEQRYNESLSAGPTNDVNERTAALRQQVAGLNAEYQQKLTTFQPDYPDMVRLNAQIEALNRSIRSEATTARSSRSGSLREEFQAARGEESALQRRVNQLSSDTLDLRGRNIRYTILRRDVDTNRSVYDGLLQRYKEIGVAGGIGNANATIVDRGRVATSPFKPNAAYNILIGAVAGLLAGLGLALLLELINDTIKTPDDVRDKLRLAFLGGIPMAKNKPVDDLSDPTSGLSEAYFSLANSLQYTSETGIPKSLLVTSTRPAEGKSTTALAIAKSFTKLGNTVLLIDADMRRPAFINKSGDDIGLSKVLTGANSLTDSVVQTYLADLWLLPAGPLPPNPAELLASPRLLAVLEEAGTAFDVVVVDGPPVLGLADAPAISAVTRATVLVVEAGKTRTRGAIEALNRLQTANARVIGSLLTRYKAQTSYGYGYGYRAGGADEAYQYRVDDKKKRQIQIGKEVDA